MDSFSGFGVSEDMEWCDVEDSDIASEESTHFQERWDVSSEINDLLTPYREHNMEPPFTPAEMIVMAVLSSETYAPTVGEILQWIIREFKYFSLKVIEEYVHTVNIDEEFVEGDERLDMVVKGFQKAFGCWAAPIQNAEGETLFVVDGLEDQVTVPVDAGRIFLRRWLEPDRKGSFRFLDLPAEVRNTIYEMVFSLPASGIRIGQNFTFSHGPSLLHRDCDCEDDIVVHDWLARENCSDFENFAPMQTLLALLSVNKQISSEAMPYLYSVNYFFVDGYDAFITFARSTPPSRFQHFSCLVIDLEDPQDGKMSLFPEAAVRPGEIKAPKKLEIWLYDEQWFHLRNDYVEGKFYKQKNFREASQVPGMNELAVALSKAESFEIEGECPRLKAFLEKRVETIKTVGVDKIPPAKRIRGQSSTSKGNEKREGAGGEDRQAKKKAKMEIKQMGEVGYEC